MATTIEKQSLKDALGDVQCYTQNLAELVGEVDKEVEVGPDGKIILEFDGVVSLLQIVWDKVKETALECEGKTIRVKLPDGIVGNLIGLALGAIGFRL